MAFTKSNVCLEQDVPSGSASIDFVYRRTVISKNMKKTQEKQIPTPQKLIAHEDLLLERWYATRVRSIRALE